MPKNSTSGSLLGSKIIPPNNPGSWIGKKWRTGITTILTALLNPKFTMLVDDGTGLLNTVDATVTMGPDGYTVLFPALLASGAVPFIPYLGAGAPAAGTLSSAYSYVASQPPSIYIDTTNKVWYYCTSAGSNSTSVWAQVGASGTQQFKVVSDGGDYWICHTFDGTTTGGTAIKVAKPYELRCDAGKITSETIDGITFTYAYTAITVSGVIIEYKRTATDPSSIIETNYVVPPVLPGKIIVAIPFTTTVPSTLTDAKWIYQSSAAWAEV